MSSVRTKIIALVTGAVVLGGCAATGEEESDDGANAVVSGRTARSSQHAAAVAIFDLGQGGVICSGAAIAPRVIVTAEHCFHDKSLTDVEVRVGSDTQATEDPYRVKSIERVTAEGTSGFVGWGADVAFLIVDRDLKIPSLPMLGRSLDSSDLSRAVDLVGYGQTKAHIDGSSGRHRKTAPAKVTLVSGRPRAKALDPATPAPDSGKELLEGYEAQVESTGDGFPCKGDSGGPYIATVDGAATVVAVQSAQTIEDANVCTSTYSIVASFGPEVQAAKARALAAAR